MLLKYIYTVFLGLLIATFVGLGIDTFYPGPQYPDYPVELQRSQPVVKDTGEVIEEPETIQKQQEYDAQMKAFEETRQVYERNVSVIAISLAVLILAISLIFAKQLDLLADGVLLGGIFSLAYGIIRGFGAQDPRFRFIVVTVGLIVASALGYLRFVHPEKKQQVQS